MDAELEFGVGDDDAALAGVFAGEGVDLHAGGTGLFGDVAADELHRFSEGDVFVVAGFGLGSGGEDGFGQFGGFGQAGGQLDAAHGLAFEIFLPAGAGEVTAHDAFDGERFGFLHDHAT